MTQIAELDKQQTDELWDFVNNEVERLVELSKAQRNARTGLCVWVDWARCNEPGNPFCEKHSGKVCVVCGLVADRQHDSTGMFLCGNFVCHRHIIAKDERKP